MTDKQIIIDGVDVKYCKRRIGKDNFCRYYKRPCAENNYNCIWKKYLRKEQEYEELRKYHNKCCEEFEREKQNLIDKYNQFSKDFFIGKYCKKEYCELLKAKEQELQQAMDNYVQLDLQRVKEYNELVDLYKAKEQENEELKKELQAQRDFTAHEQKLIYCVAYDETCKTGNDCKQKKCIFKDNIKLKLTLTDIKEIVEKSMGKGQMISGGWLYQKISEVLEND